MQDGTYWVNVGWACGALDVLDGKVNGFGSAPIFRRWDNSSAEAFIKRHVRDIRRLGEEG